VIEMLLFTGPSGQYVAVNPTEVASIRSPRGTDHVSRELHCLIFTVDGKFVGVVDPCVKVRQRIEEMK
jgi:hypothetical protein